MTGTIRRFTGISGIVAACTLVLSGNAVAQCPNGAPPPCSTPARATKPTFAVEPFQNLSTDSADAYLASSITDDLTSLVKSVPGLQLVTGGGEAHYRLRGSVRRVGASLQLSARLEQSGKIVWAAPLRLPSRNLASAPDSIGAAALKAIGIVRPARRSLHRGDADVFDLYARGVYQMNRRNQPALARAVTLFQQAIERDSSSAYGWIGLARALERSSNWRFAIPGVNRDSVLTLERIAADRAGELAPDDPDVWLMRGRVAADVDVTTRSAAVRAYRRALELDSLNGEAWQALGLTLVEVDDTAGARVALERAVAASPRSGEIVAQLALFHMWKRAFDVAARWADSAVSLDPTHTLVRNVAGFVAYYRDRLDDAESHFEASRRLSTGPQIDGHAGLAKVAARRGDIRRARDLLGEALARTDSARPVAHASQLLAEVYLVLGDTVAALEWLERYSPRRDMHFQMHMRYEPGLEPLRNNARFATLVARP